LTTEPSIRAMLDPRMVAANVIRLRSDEDDDGANAVVLMKPSSRGGGATPSIDRKW
jgi:hypothetical protein